MYVLYYRRQRLLGIMAAVGLLLVLGFTAWHWLAGRAVPTMKIQPIYQGNPERKAVALTFTIDWGKNTCPLSCRPFKRPGRGPPFSYRPVGRAASRLGTADGGRRS